jgi:hypothetical protein
VVVGKSRRSLAPLTSQGNAVQIRPGARGEIEFYVAFVLVEPSLEEEGLSCMQALQAKIRKPGTGEF